MSLERMRELSLETSGVAVRNIAGAGRSGPVTLIMDRGVVRQVWIGEQNRGLLVWKDGQTLVHVLANVDPPLVHGR